MEQEALTLEGKKELLFLEIRIAFRMFEQGMRHLQVIPCRIELIHLPILILSTSLERLLKCLICLVLVVQGGENLQRAYNQKRGHDLKYLLGRLLHALDQVKDTPRFEKARPDIEAIGQDRTLVEIFKVFSEFGQGARYYNLDMVMKGESIHKDPIQTWDNIEMGIFAFRGKKIPPRNKLNEGIRNEITGALVEFQQRVSKLFEAAGLSLSDQASH